MQPPLRPPAADLDTPPRRSRWGRLGYRAGEVDAFLMQVHAALARDRPGMAPYEVADVRFPAARFRRSYSLRAVDDRLLEIERVLRERHGDATVAGLEGRERGPRHTRTWWVYAVAAVLVAAMVGFAVSQLR